MPGQSRARNRMVDVQISAAACATAHVLEAMRQVPREAFVEPGFEEFAYEDSAAAASAKARPSRSPTSSR